MAKEGFIFVLSSLLLGVIFLVLNIPFFSMIIAVLMFIMAAYFAFFFRDPKRKIIAEPGEIISPVDGLVVDINENEKKLAIFLSIFDVHITRFPYTGTLKKIQYFKGCFLPAYKKNASELNERATLTVDSEKLSYILKLIAGVAARRIKIWIREGERVKTGDKIGIIMFGSRAELEFPDSVELQVKKGDKLTGGLTLIGKVKN